MNIKIVLVISVLSFYNVANGNVLTSVACGVDGLRGSEATEASYPHHRQLS